MAKTCVSGSGNATLEYPDGDNIGVVTAFEPPDEFDGITTYHLQQVQIAMSKGDDRSEKPHSRIYGLVI